MKVVKDIASKIPSEFEQAQKQAEKAAKGGGDKVKEEFETAKKPRRPSLVGVGHGQHPSDHRYQTA
ncbi:MAG: hypothetical protein AAFU49_12845 [Pseudomonadota bacterium]